VAHRELDVPGAVVVHVEGGLRVEPERGEAFDVRELGRRCGAGDTAAGARRGRGGAAALVLVAVGVEGGQLGRFVGGDSALVGSGGDDERGRRAVVTRAARPVVTAVAGVRRGASTGGGAVTAVTGVGVTAIPGLEVRAKISVLIATAVNLTTIAELDLDIARRRRHTEAAAHGGRRGLAWRGRHGESRRLVVVGVGRGGLAWRVVWQSCVSWVLAGLFVDGVALELAKYHVGGVFFRQLGFVTAKDFVVRHDTGDLELGADLLEVTSNCHAVLRGLLRPELFDIAVYEAEERAERLAWLHSHRAVEVARFAKGQPGLGGGERCQQGQLGIDRVAVVEVGLQRGEDWAGQDLHLDEADTLGAEFFREFPKLLVRELLDQHGGLHVPRAVRKGAAAKVDGEIKVHPERIENHVLHHQP
jgi:hypothetical protein